MIYTVTLNPAIDYIVRLDHVETGAVNRMAQKINSPVVRESMSVAFLKRLDIENTATGFIGGLTGRFIEDVLTSETIATNFVHSGPRYTDQCQNQSRSGNRDQWEWPRMLTEAQLQELLKHLIEPNSR